MMRTRISVIALVLILCGSVFAAKKPAMNIPIYPGGESTMEINLTNDDLLPVLKAMLPMATEKLGAAGEKINADDIGAALKDVKQIQVLQLDIAKNATESNIADYYANNLPAGDWTRVFWQNSSKMGMAAIYVQNGGEKLFGFRVQQVMDSGKSIKRVQIVRTDGKIDFVKLLSIAGKVFMP